MYNYSLTYYNSLSNIYDGLSNWMKSLMIWSLHCLWLPQLTLHQLTVSLTLPLVVSSSPLPPASWQCVWITDAKLGDTIMKERYAQSFVNTSAIWLLVGIKVGRMTPDLIFSLTKWQSISMCFVLSCCTGLAARAIEDWLSQKIGTGVIVGIWRSFRRLSSQVTSHVQSAKALYSASVDDLETTNCFFDCQEMRQGPR